MTRMLKITVSRVEISSDDPFYNFCKIMGLESNCDKDNTIIKIIHYLHQKGGLNSTQISRLTNKSRGSVLNHLDTLIDKGIIFKYGKEYKLKDQNFENLVELIEKDITETIKQLKKYAKILDDEI